MKKDILKQQTNGYWYGNYEQSNGTTKYGFFFTETEGELAQMNHGEYTGVSVELFIFSDGSVKMVDDNDDHTETTDIDRDDWEQARDSFEYTEGTDKNIQEVFNRFIDGLYPTPEEVEMDTQYE